MKTKFLLATAVACFYFATASFAQTVPSYVPTNGLVGWWPFNGNADDESGNGNNGTVNGATLTSDRNGNNNAAYSFDGVDDKINILHNSILNMGLNDFSISFYFNVSTPTNDLRYILGKRFYSLGNGYSVYINNNGKINAEILDNNSTTDNSSTTNIISSNWYFFTVVFNRNGNSEIYINGVLESSLPISNENGSLTNSNDLFIGYFGQSGPACTNGCLFFEGKLDDIGIWNRALTQQEITALYQSNNCSVPAYVPTNGLVGYWPFCGNANDVSGNGNNGTVNGATLTTDRNGNANEAYSFDGVDDFIETFNINLPVGNSSRTFSSWFLLTPTVGYNDGYSLISYGSTLTPSGGLNDIFIKEQLIEFNTHYYYVENTTINNTTNQWRNLTIVYDSTDVDNVTIYVDGVLIPINKFNLAGLTQLSTIATQMFIGKVISPYASDFFFNGKIDDIAIWNRSLTQQEISNIYTSGCTKPEPVSLGTSASTRLCPSESVTIEIVSPADSANYTYQWTRNGTNMIGATTRSITVNDAAKYKVFVSSGPGVDCRRVSGLVETTPSIPPAVVATAPNGTSYCPGDSVLMTATGATAGYSYRWKRFGVVIPGANSNTFYATQTGNYRCEIYNAGGCITQSNLISITNGTSCRIMEQTNSDVSVYPNPAQNAFTVSFNDIGNETPVSVSLRSIQGQVIEQRNIAGKADVQFAVNKLAPGLYVVIIQLESGDSIEKTVVVE